MNQVAVQFSFPRMVALINCSHAYMYIDASHVNEPLPSSRQADGRQVCLHGYYYFLIPTKCQKQNVKSLHSKFLAVLERTAGHGTGRVPMHQMFLANNGVRYVKPVALPEEQHTTTTMIQQPP